MACYYPLQGFASKQLTGSGKRKFVFLRRDGYEDMPMIVPCGQCVGCLIDRSRAWAVRCCHEASLHSANCFLTLTYSPEYIPADGSLDHSYLQKFLKRLRKKYGSGIKYLCCGEYGDKLLRPHYHLLLFNFDFPDKEFFRNSGSSRLFISSSLSQLWKFGFSTIGDVTFQSSAYVSRYVLKKQFGKKEDVQKYYASKKPEYLIASKGIARDWFERYWSDVYPRDYVVMNGKKVRPPRYYDKLLEERDSAMYKLVKFNRKRRALDRAFDNTPARLRVREECQRARVSRLPRLLESP